MANDSLGVLRVYIGANVSDFEKKMGHVTSVIDRRVAQWERRIKRFGKFYRTEMGMAVKATGMGFVGGGGGGRGTGGGGRVRPPRLPQDYLDQFKHGKSSTNGIYGNIGTALTAVYAMRRLTSGMGRLIQESAALETAFTGVIKTVDPTAGQMVMLREELEALATEIPITIEEIYGIAEAAGQLGIQTNKITDFTKVMAALAATTNMTAEQAATDLARFANITQMSQDDFARLGSVVVQLGNNFATTEAEMVNMSLRMAAAGSQAGLTQADIMGFATALSSLGMRSEMGGSSFTRFMINMQEAVDRGGKKLDLYAKTAGMTADAFRAMHENDPSEVILRFASGLNALNKVQADTTKILSDLGLKGIRVAGVMLRNLANGALLTRSAIEMANEEWELNQALMREAALRYGTLDSAMQRFRSRSRLLAAHLGDQLRPSFVAILKALTNVVEWLRKSSDEFKKMIAMTAGLVTFAVAIEAVALAFALLTAVMKKSKAALVLLKPVVAGITILLGSLGYAATKVSLALGRTKNSVTALETVISQFFDAFLDWKFIPTFFDGVKISIKEVVLTSINWLGILSMRLAKITMRVQKTLLNIAKKVIAVIERIVDTLMAKIVNLGVKSVPLFNIAAKLLGVDIGKEVADLLGGFYEGVGGVLDEGIRIVDRGIQQMDAMETAILNQQVALENAAKYTFADIAAQKKQQELMDAQIASIIDPLREVITKQAGEALAAAGSRDRDMFEKAQLAMQEAMVASTKKMRGLSPDAMRLAREAQQQEKARMMDALSYWEFLSVPGEDPGSVFKDVVDSMLNSLDRLERRNEHRTSIEAINKKYEDRRLEAAKEAARQQRVSNKKVVDDILARQNRTPGFFTQVALRRFSVRGMAGVIDRKTQNVRAQGVEAKLEVLIDVTRQNRPLATV